MKLFGWMAGREGARPALSRHGVGVPAGEWPRSYEAQVREAYLGNAVAQRAVRLVADGVGEAVLLGSDRARGLVSARTAGQALLATVAAQLLLHGNAYLQVLRGTDGEAAELFALRPERVTLELDAGGWPAAYLYRVGERAMRLGADPVRPEVIHIRSFHPLDDHHGLGCLGAAAGAVAIHNAATRWHKALLDNAARPSGALVYDPGDGSALSADQFDRLKTEMEAGFAGAANAGRPMLLEGGLKWQAMSLSPADMDFAECKAAAAREIALAFGVPPMLLGLPGDATYANYREANRALWRLAVLPLADAILEPLNQGLGGWIEERGLAVDLNRVAALAEDRERLWAQVSGADFLSADEKRAIVGGGVRIAGYAAVFGVRDRAGDVVVPGAFGDAFGAPGAVPLLHQHRGGAVGRIEAIGEDARGLRVEAVVEDAGVADLVRGGALRGLSVGYRPVVVEQGARRVLRRVTLVEVSLVAVPMQALARVDNVFNEEDET